MKNLMIYINPVKRFKGDTGVLIKIQIDNSLNLGWKRKDIILVTNFPYEYNGVKALVVGDENYCEVHSKASKVNAILTLFEKGFFKGNELYWLHDLDAFQQDVITEEELELGNADVALSDYGWRSQVNTGSMFFKSSFKDIFVKLKEGVYASARTPKRLDEEKVMVNLVKVNFNNIQERIKKLNIGYNLGIRKVEDNYKRANGKIKIVHFHPLKRNLLERFRYGKNGLGIPLMTLGLIKVFKYHGIK